MKTTRGSKDMAKSSNKDILLEELRIIQAEMKSTNISLGRMQTTLESVESQTLKTNGRVNRLETWRTAFVAGLTAIGLLLAYEWQAFNAIIDKLAQ